MDIRLDCEKFIIIDNNELSYHLNNVKEAKFFHKHLNINNLIESHQYKEILFLFPPSNVSKFKEQYPDLNARVFFKSIINTIKFVHDRSPRNTKIISSFKICSYRSRPKSLRVSQQVLSYPFRYYCRFLRTIKDNSIMWEVIPITCRSRREAALRVLRIKPYLFPSRPGWSYSSGNDTQRRRF